MLVHQKTRLSFILIFLLFFGCQNNSTSTDQEVQNETEAQTQQTADFNPNKNAYFGDLHVHTSWSFDAFIYNVRTSPDDAYRFGKGEAIDHFVANKIQLKRPLDFMAVTDHSEYMGIMRQMIDPESPLAELQIAKNVRSEDRATSLRAFGLIGTSISRNEPIDALIQEDIIRSTWQRQVEAANKHYEPGKFTTFPAYEWTSSPGVQDHEPTFARNMHRNVIYKSDKVSDLPYSSFDSQNPEDLWNWMEKEREKGIEVMAIPHNANMSDGMMFALQTMDGKPLTKAYAESRQRNEPIQEVVQVKGQSMSHPMLSPNDEFAEFEMYEYTFSIGVPPPSQAQGSYVRRALHQGIALEKDLGANPFKFGLIGSSDGHNGGGPIEEDNYFGKFGNMDGSPETRVNPNERFLRVPYFSAAGLAGVWAEENTRASIFEAMQSRETFATSGPRIKVRFFAGWEFDNNLLDAEDWVAKAYDSGVAMGSDLPAADGAPSFLIWAIKDSEGANLDRIQVIKGWVDEDGQPQEKIFEVAWAGDRKVDAYGKLPAIGTTVDLSTATYTNDIGAVLLQTQWQDPDFDPNTAAVYYLRVLEIPTPRWSTYDAVAVGKEPLELVPSTIQERAWSSPIWYTPEQ